MERPEHDGVPLDLEDVLEPDVPRRETAGNRGRSASAPRPVDARTTPSPWLSRKRAVNPPPSALEATKSSLGERVTSTPAFSRHDRVFGRRVGGASPPQPATQERTVAAHDRGTEPGGAAHHRRFSHGGPGRRRPEPPNLRQLPRGGPLRDPACRRRVPLAPSTGRE